MRVALRALWGSRRSMQRAGRARRCGLPRSRPARRGLNARPGPSPTLCARSAGSRRGRRAPSATRCEGLAGWGTAMRSMHCRCRPWRLRCAVLLDPRCPGHHALTPPRPASTRSPSPFAPQEWEFAKVRTAGSCSCRCLGALTFQGHARPAAAMRHPTPAAPLPTLRSLHPPPATPRSRRSSRAARWRSTNEPATSQGPQVGQARPSPLNGRVYHVLGPCPPPSRAT
jgi:hypothetical protein